MEERPCDMKLLRTPFRTTGIQILQPTVVVGGQQTTGMPVGSRGVRQLVNQKVDMSTSKNSGGVSTAAATAPLRVASLHHDGRLLLWNCADNTLVASCEHGANNSVVQCLTTPEFLFVRLESAPGSEGLEDDANVHVWCAKTFKRVRTLRGHETRVTAMAISDSESQSPFLATASLDRTVRVWRVTGTTTETVQTLPLDGCGTVSGLAFVGQDVLVAAGSLSPVTVWQWPTKQRLAASPADAARATTVLRVLSFASASNGKTHSSLSPPPRKSAIATSAQRSFSIFIGCTDGFVLEHVLELEHTMSTTTPASQGSVDRSTHETPSGSWRAALKLTWKGKPHTATVGGLHVDGPVLATCSMYDGAYIVNRTTGVARLLGPKTATGATASIGCTSLVMDAANKRLLVGAHTGEVYIWNYAEFATQAAKEVHLVASFTPHLSAVTGICLELSSGNVWERLLTCGGEGDVCVLDYRRSTRGAVVLPSAVNCAVVTRLKVHHAHGAVEGAVAFLPAKSDGVTDAALCVADEKTMLPVPNGTRGLMIGKSVVAVAWCALTSEMLVATSDAVVMAFCFGAAPDVSASSDAGSWRKTRQWTLNANYDVICFSEANHPHFVALGLSSKRGEGGAIAVLGMREHATATTGAVAFRATPGVRPQSVALVGARETVTGANAMCAVVVEMKNGAVQVYASSAQTNAAANFTLQAAAVLSPGRPTAATALARNRLARTIAVSLDLDSASGAATVRIPTDKAISVHRCSPSGVTESLPASRYTFTTNVLSVTAVEQSGIGLVVLCEHSSDAYLCDMTGTPTHVVSATGGVAPVTSVATGKAAAATSNSTTASSKEPRCVSYPGAAARRLSTGTVGNASNSAARVPYCLAVVLEKDRRFLAFAYDNGLIQLLDTSCKYVFARLWGPEGPFAATTLTSIVPVRDYVVAAAEQCALTALPVPHRALMDT